MKQLGGIYQARLGRNLREAGINASLDPKTGAARIRDVPEFAVEHFSKRVRPKVKSFKAIELYGDAVTQTDEKKKVELLKLSLNERPIAISLRLPSLACPKTITEAHTPELIVETNRDLGSSLWRNLAEELDEFDLVNAFVDWARRLAQAN